MQELVGARFMLVKIVFIKNPQEPLLNCDNVGSMVAENGKIGTLWLNVDNARLAPQFTDNSLDQKLYKYTDGGESWQQVSKV
jgi:hypothetical protein